MPPTKICQPCLCLPTLAVAAKTYNIASNTETRISNKNANIQMSLLI